MVISEKAGRTVECAEYYAEPTYMYIPLLLIVVQCRRTAGSIAKS